MHIPDGFLNTPAWSTLYAVSGGTLAVAFKKVKKMLQDKTIPLMGVISAFIFAAQMLNFPVAGGTSGHLIGGVLAAVLLGPWAGIIVISAVLVIQCLLFQDGGITALGANIFNMGIIGSGLGYVIYDRIRKLIPDNKGVLTGAAIASWLAVVIASFACALELGFSGLVKFKVVIPAMVGVHTLIGIGEAIITVLVIGIILKLRPDLIYRKEER
ncbi:MAG: energy-coupling factor ABC transporter permease [Candidatus Omnitrophica bacterium]|nr:energy-coupling factor ABC transporter permease [Candidatus Omnitrophota bacterium]